MSAWKWERRDGKLVRPWGFRAVFWTLAAALVGTHLYTVAVVLCDSEIRNCKECRDLCSPLPVSECVEYPDKTVKCLCDGRETQQKYERKPLTK
jgi:hypothetical protein